MYGIISCRQPTGPPAWGLVVGLTTPLRKTRMLRNVMRGLGLGRILCDITDIIQGDRKVTQTILKCLLMVSIQYNSIGLLT
jgi:hypothetical protein